VLHFSLCDLVRRFHGPAFDRFCIFSRPYADLLVGRANSDWKPDVMLKHARMRTHDPSNSNACLPRSIQTDAIGYLLRIALLIL